MPESGNPVEKIAGIVIVIAMSVGIWVSSSPLHSARPVSPDVADLEVACDAREGVQARLWEDPLLAVRVHARDVHPEGDDDAHETLHTHESFRQYFRHEIEAGPGRWSVRFLPVLLQGAPYMEDREMRLRARYAVLSALARMEFAPLDPRRLQIVVDDFRTYPIDVLVRSTSSGTDERNRTAEYAVVVWVNDQDLARDAGPAQTLVDLSLALWPAETGVADPERCHVAIVGPTSSDALKSFEESLPAAVTFAAKRGWSLRIVSPYATSRDAEWNGEGIEPSIGTDRGLAHALVRELHRRRCCPASKGNRLVLLAEWDTHYGRAWINIFRDALEAHVEEDQDHIGCDTSRCLARNVEYFAYMRGLDGKLPRDHETPPPSSPTQSGPDSSAGDGSRRAEDRSRFDYIRRLQDRLALDDGEIRACGVLGSDLYDKLLLLQALRPELRGAVFFTTDLDARLLGPTEYPWTRNLVIASHYGLEPDLDLPGRVEPRLQPKPRPEWTMKTPPLRGSYQTSMFLATMMALGRLSELDTDAEPKLFEIGRSGAVLLDRHDHDGLTFFGEHKRSIIVVLLAVVAIALTVSGRWRRGRPRWRRLASVWKVQHWALPGAFLVSTILIVRMIQVSRMAEEEPWAWMDGISVWPSELVRLLAFVTSVAAMVYAHSSLRRNAATTTHRFFGDRDSKGGAGSDSNPPWRVCVARWDLSRAGPMPARRVWHDYLRLGRFRCCSLRVAVMLVLYIAFASACFTMSRPPRGPVRGPLSQSLDKFIIVISVLSMNVLILFVIDATRLCNRFIRNISESNVRWPGRNQQESVAARIELIADRTAAVSRLIYAPFVVLLIMIVARHSVFDDWDWTPALIGVFAINLAAATAAALMLRRRADWARKQAIRALQERRSLTSMRLVERIQAIKVGAYGAFYENPVLRAVLIPFGGLGTIGLVRLLS